MGLPRDPTAGETCVCGKEILTKSAAKSHAKRQERKTGTLFDAYPCRRATGRGWHVGKANRGRNR